MSTRRNKKATTDTKTAAPEGRKPLAEVQLQPKQVKTLERLQSERDLAAQAIGAAWLQFNGFAHHQQTLIAKASQEEQQYSKTIIEEAGHKIDEGTWGRQGSKLVRVR